MKRILILFAHPALERSRVNRRLAAAKRHDQKAYLRAARQRIEDLEALFLGDLADPGEMRDAGWDPESLRAEYGGAAREAPEEPER